MPIGLESGPWLYAVAAAFVLGHLLVLLHMARRGVGPSRGRRTPGRGPEGLSPEGQPTDGGGAGQATAPPADLPPVDGDQVVLCPHCSVRNQAEFRFCRYCTGELSGGTTVGS